MKTASAIAGGDSNGGTGIQADTGTMAAYGIYTVNAIAALATRSTTGVTGIVEMTPPFLKEQLDDIFTDIFPDTVRTGTVPSGGLIEAIGDRLAFYRIANVVMGPVMVSASDSWFISGEAIEVPKGALLPITNLLIPNIPGVEMLLEVEIHNPGDMERAARTARGSYDRTVLFKGGHQLDDASDLLYRYRELKWLNGRRIDSPDTHRTDCTLSGTTASNLAKGMDMDLAAERAKVCLPGTPEAQLGLGKGGGPVDYGFAIRGEY